MGMFHIYVTASPPQTQGLSSKVFQAVPSRTAKKGYPPYTPPKQPYTLPIPPLSNPIGVVTEAEKETETEIEKDIDIETDVPKPNHPGGVAACRRCQCVH